MPSPTENPDPIAIGGKAVRRRVRKFQGATWTPQSMSAEPDDGVWCKACKKRHGYMNLKTQYEKGKGGWVLLWVCKVTGNVIGDLPLSSGHRTY